MKVVNEMNRKNFFLLIFIFFITGCRSKDGAFNVFSTETDLQLGRQFNAQFKNISNAPLLSESEYPDAYEHLRYITHSILKSHKILYRDEFPWEVYIVEDDNVLNAFCTPGGYIYVYTGLIKYLDSEDQLAGVIGHEIAHADLRHSTRQLTKSYGLGIILKIFFGSSSFIGDLAGNLLGLTFSRSDETEADIKSVEYLNDTQYDPRGVARFFEKIESGQGTSAVPEFLSTHPNPENRVENIYKEWKLLGSRQGKRFIQEYLEFKASLP